MKFRIMLDGNGKYVQKKNMFGIWRNWLIHCNSPTIGKHYYDFSVDEIIATIKSSNKMQESETLKEFTV